MKQALNSNLKSLLQRMVVVALVLLLLLTIGLLWRGATEGINPIAAAFWRLHTWFEVEMPQESVWTFLILLGTLRLVLSIVFSFTGYRSNLQTSARPNTGRVSYWLSLLNTRQRARRLFIRPFRYLVINVLAYKEQRPYEEMMNRLHRNQLELPPHLQTYLLEADKPTVQTAQMQLIGQEPALVEILEELEKSNG